MEELSKGTEKKQRARIKINEVKKKKKSMKCSRSQRKKVFKRKSVINSINASSNQMKTMN